MDWCYILGAFYKHLCNEILILGFKIKLFAGENSHNELIEGTCQLSGSE